MYKAWLNYGQIFFQLVLTQTYLFIAIHALFSRSFFIFALLRFSLNCEKEQETVPPF